MAIIGADQISLVDLTDGYSVFMSPESMTFPATATAAIPTSVSLVVTALKGATPVNVDIGVVTGNTGITPGTIAGDNTKTATIPLTITAALTTQGYIDVPVTVDGDITITKRFSYSLAKQGAVGTNSVNVIIGNESTVVPTTASGASTAAVSINIPFAGYNGTARIACTATIVTTPLPSGLTVGTIVSSAPGNDGNIPITIASGATLGGDLSGNIVIDFVAAGQTHRKFFTWSKALAGTAGADGADAINMDVISSNGTYFKNTSIATTLTAKVFKNGTELTEPQINLLGVIRWYKDDVANTTADAVNTGRTYVISAGLVQSKVSYEVRLESI